MKRSLLLLGLILSAAACSDTSGPDGENDGPFEVWMIDQGDTRADGGGTLYIYQGADLTGAGAASATPVVIDLGGAVHDMCVASTGSAPRRPHMLLFNQAATHGVVAYVATGHVAFISAASRQPVGCVDVGLQAHAATPSPDGRFVVVANQNGKLLQRISTNYATNTFTLDAAATLDLANGVTPRGAARQDPTLRPDNAPICSMLDSTGNLAFVTLRGGGLFVVNPTVTPMVFLAEYDQNAVHPNGCGGMEAGGSIFINSGGGTATNPTEFDVYRLPLTGYSAASPPNTPPAALVYSGDSEGFVDSHGMTLTGRNRYLWVADRAANRIEVFEVGSGARGARIELAGQASPDPAPDLMVTSPSGRHVFAALRGPNPLTANVPGVNNAVGSTPGLGIIEVGGGGARGTLTAVARVSRQAGGVEAADPHGIALRSTR